MNDSTKLGLVLLVIFTTCLFALILQLVYLLQRKRTTAVNGSAISFDSAAQLSDSQFCGSPTSKELLYFFCCKNKPTRVEPSSGVPSMTLTEDATEADSEEEDYDNELAKWHGVYEHSMILYTIKEGEREGADSVEDSSGRRSEAKSERRVCSTDCLSGRVEMTNDVAVVVVEEEEETPCAYASSAYFTPSTSLDRDDDGISILSSGSDDVGPLRVTDRKAGMLV